MAPLPNVLRQNGTLWWYCGNKSSVTLPERTLLYVMHGTPTGRNKYLYWCHRQPRQSTIRNQMHDLEDLRNARVRYAHAKRLYESAERELGKMLLGTSSTGWLPQIEVHWKRLHLDALLTGVVSAEEELVEAFRRAVRDDPAVRPDVKHKVRVLLFSRHPDASADLLEMAFRWRCSTTRSVLVPSLQVRRLAVRHSVRVVRGFTGPRR